jgi:hypothetical protein
MDFRNDTRVQMAPSPILPLPFTSLSSQTAILIVLFPQVAAVSTVFLAVIHMIVVTISIVVPPVMVMVVIGLNGHDRDQQNRTQQECAQATHHLITLLNVRTYSKGYQAYPCIV